MSSSLKGLVPVSLRIENGLTYKSTSLPLENQGLVFVRGVNHDTDQQRSNGSGKSSFADIFEHILFDTTSRGLSGDDIIRAGSSEGFYGELKFKLQKDTYIVKQSRKHSKHKDSLSVWQQTSQGFEEISAPKNINKAKQKLKEILRMTSQQFHGYVYLSQDAGSPLVTGTGSEVSKYLSSTFGYDVYDDMRRRVKDLIDELQDKVKQSDAYIVTVKDIDTKLSEFKNIDFIMEMEDGLTAYINYGQEQFEFLYETRNALAKNKAAAERWAQLQQAAPKGVTLDELQEQKIKRTKLLSAVSKQLLELKTQKALIESRASTLARIEEVESELKELKDPKAIPVFVPKTITDYTVALKDLNSTLATVGKLISHGENLFDAEITPPDGWDDSNLVKSHEDAIETFQTKGPDLLSVSSQYQKLKEALDSSTCPTCGQEVPQAESKEHLETEIAKTLTAKKQYKDLMVKKTLAENFLAACAEYTSHKTEIDDFLKSLELFIKVDLNEDPKTTFENFCTSHDTRLFKDAIQYVTTLKEVIGELDLLKQHLPDGAADDANVDFASKISKLQDKETKLKSDLDRTLGDIKVLEDLNSTMPVLGLAELEKQDADLLGEINSLKSAIKNTQSILNKFSNDSALIRDLQTRKSRSMAYLDQFKDDIKQLEWLKNLYKGLAKLKARKLHAVVQSLRDILPQYVDLMFDGEDISFDINDDDPESVLLWAVRKHPEKAKERVWIPVKGLSKGERAGLRVSLLWTLKDIMQPEKSVDLLILDEADDGLDEAGLAAFCSLLEKIKTQYGTVIVISQRRELTGVHFDQVWTAVKRDGITTIEMN